MPQLNSLQAEVKLINRFSSEAGQVIADLRTMQQEAKQTAEALAKIGGAGGQSGSSGGSRSGGKGSGGGGVSRGDISFVEQMIRVLALERESLESSTAGAVGLKKAMQDLNAARARAKALNVGAGDGEDLKIEKETKVVHRLIDALKVEERQRLSTEKSSERFQIRLDLLQKEISLHDRVTRGLISETEARRQLKVLKVASSAGTPEQTERFVRLSNQLNELKKNKDSLNLFTKENNQTTRERIKGEQELAKIQDQSANSLNREVAAIEKLALAEDKLSGKTKARFAIQKQNQLDKSFGDDLGNRELERQKAIVKNNEEFIRQKDREAKSEEARIKKSQQIKNEQAKSEAEEFRNKERILASRAKETIGAERYISRLRSEVELRQQVAKGTITQAEAERRLSNARNLEGFKGTKEQLQQILGLQRQLSTLPGGSGDIKGVSGLLGRVGSFLLRFSAFTLAAGILTRAFFSAQQALTGLVSRGIEFNKSAESTKLSFSAILASSRQLANSQGRVADVSASYPIFIGKAANFYRELLFLNIKTLGTGKELQGVFQRVLAFTQDQKTTDSERLQLTQNILNASKLLGLTGEQANVEARQILTLERDQGQTILQSLGLRAKELRIYKEQGTLVQELNERLKAYSVIAEDSALTFEGLTSTVETFVDSLSGAAFENTFSGVKVVLKGIADELASLFKTGSIFSFLTSSESDLRKFGTSVGSVMASVIKSIADATNATIDFFAANREALSGVGKLTSPIVTAFGNITTAIAIALQGVLQLGSAIGNLKSPAIFEDSKFVKFIDSIFGGAATGATLGAGAGFIFGGPGGALAGARVGAAIGSVSNAVIEFIKGQKLLETQDKALQQFRGKIATRITGIADELSQLPAKLASNPELFNQYLKEIANLQKELDRYRNLAQELPEPFKTEEITKIDQVKGKFEELTGALEQTKDKLSNLFPAKLAEDFNRFGQKVDELRRKAEQGQRDLTTARSLYAQGKTTSQVDVFIAGDQAAQDFEASRKDLIEQLAARNVLFDKINELNEKIRQSLYYPNTRIRTFQQTGPPVPDKDLLSQLRVLQGQVPEASKTFAFTGQGAEADFEATKEVVRQYGMTVTETAQKQKDLSDSLRETEKNAESLRVAIADLREKTAQTNRGFEESFADLAQLDGTDVLSARLDEIGKEAQEAREKFEKSIGGKAPQEFLLEQKKLIAAQEKKATLESLKIEEEASKKRFENIKRQIDTEKDLADARIEVQKTVAESQKADLEFQLDIAEKNAGIYGRTNNSLEDRILLLQEIGQKEAEIIKLDIQNEENKQKAAKEEVEGLRKEIEDLEGKRQKIIDKLKSQGVDGDKAELLRSDPQLEEKKAEQARSQAEIEQSGKNIDALQGKLDRAILTTQTRIGELGETIVNLNDPIANLFGNLADSFTGSGNILKGVANTFKSFGKDIQRSMSDAFRESIKKKLNFDQVFKGNIFELGGFFKDTFSNAVNFVGDLFSGFGNKSTASSGGFFSGIGNFFSSLFGGGSGGSTGGSGPLSFLSNIFGGGSGSGGGFFSSIGKIFGGGSSVSGGSSGGGFLGSLFGGGGGGGGAIPSGTVFSQAPSSGGPLAGLSGGSGVFLPGQGGAGGGLLNSIGGGGGGGLLGSFGAGIFGNSAGNLFGGLFGGNRSKGNANLGGTVGGGVGTAIGAYFGAPQVGAGIGSFIGNLIGGLFSPVGRIEKEKKGILKFIKQAIPGAKIVKEQKAASRLSDLSEVDDALLGLGTVFATRGKKKKSNQGTAIRLAGQLAGNLPDDVELAKKTILELADSLQIDLGSGIKAINKALGDDILSFKNFDKELKDARKNLKQYGDTSNLTVKQLNDLALANGSTGSKILTLSDALAGIIDISTEFDPFISGATVANNYLADSFIDAAKEGDLFNDRMKGIAEEIRKGNLTIEEGVIQLNDLRESIGLAKLTAKDFTINSDEIERQVETIQKAVDSLRGSISSALSQSLTKDFKPGDVQKAFRKAVYQSLVDTIVDGFIDGFIKASGAAEVLTAAFAGVSSTLKDFFEGTITEEEAFSKIGASIEEARPKIEKIAELLGVSADHLRDMLGSTGILNELFDETVTSLGDIGSQINESAKNAFVQGIQEGQSSQEIVQSFKEDLYTSLVTTIAGAFIEGAIKGIISGEVISAAEKQLTAIVKAYNEGDLSKEGFTVAVGNLFGGVKSEIDAVGDTIGIISEQWNNAFAGTDASKYIKKVKDDLTDIGTQLNESAKSAFVQGILEGQSSEEITASFKKNFYTSLVTTIAEAFIEGAIQGIVSGEVIKEAQKQLAVITKLYKEGSLSKEGFTVAIGNLFGGVKTEIDAVGNEIGIISEQWNNAFGDSEAIAAIRQTQNELNGLASTLSGGISSAVIDGITNQKTQAEIEKSIRASLYKSVFEAVVEGFINGIVQAALTKGPLEAALKQVTKLSDQFIARKITGDEFRSSARDLFDKIEPELDALAQAGAITAEEFTRIAEEGGFLADILGDVANEAKELADTLRKAARDLLLDDALSPLKPKERTAQAKITFEELLARARAGDKEAAKQLPEAGRELLAEARKVFASSEEYERLFDFVRGSLLDVADIISIESDIQEQQLRTLQEIRDEVKILNGSNAKTPSISKSKDLTPSKTTTATPIEDPYLTSFGQNQNKNIPSSITATKIDDPYLTSFGQAKPIQTTTAIPIDDPYLANFGQGKNTIAYGPNPLSVLKSIDENTSKTTDAIVGNNREVRSLNDNIASSNRINGQEWIAMQGGSRNGSGPIANPASYSLGNVSDQTLSYGTGEYIPTAGNNQKLIDLLDKVNQYGILPAGNYEIPGSNGIYQYNAFQNSEELIGYAQSAGVPGYLGTMNISGGYSTASTNARFSDPNALGSSNEITPFSGTKIATSLAEGGIVTGKEVPAMLHGPEAVIPLGQGKEIGVSDIGTQDLLGDAVKSLNSIDKNVSQGMSSYPYLSSGSSELRSISTSTEADRQALSYTPVGAGFVAPDVPRRYSEPGAYPWTADTVGLKPKFGSSGTLENPPNAYNPWLMPGQTLEEAFNLNYHNTAYAAWGNPLKGNEFVGYNVKQTEDAMRTSLAEGGIVLGREVPAMLHGPEAVIPLPHNANIGNFNSSSPELIEEVRALRRDLSMMEESRSNQPIMVQGDVHLGEQKIGKFVDSRVQQQLNRQQIRVPRESLVNVRAK